MSLLDTLLGIFSNSETHEEFQANPEGFLAAQGHGDVTAQDIQAEMPQVLQAFQGNSGGATQGGAASFASSGNVTLPPPPAASSGGGYAEGGLSGAVESINHYTNVLNINSQTFQDNDTTYIDDRDTTVDNSVNQNIQAFGDVNQNFDNDVVSGDGAVAAGDYAQVNTGDGAVQAGGDITDSTIATGDVGGSVTGDVTDSIVGDGNQAIQNSDVGAAAFGSGDATNVEAGNAVLGDGTIVDANGDVALNQGSGDLTQIQDSTLSESVVGDGTVQSNDTTVDAGDGNAFAFGDGDATADTQTTDIDGNYGNVQVAGDHSDQAIDNSVDIADSGNVTDSGNVALDYSDHSVDNSVDIADSGNIAVDYSDHSVDNSVDIDNSGNTTVDAGPEDVIEVI
jgi:hypothetical protein